MGSIIPFTFKPFVRFLVSEKRGCGSWCCIRGDGKRIRVREEKQRKKWKWFMLLKKGPSCVVIIEEKTAWIKKRKTEEKCLKLWREEKRDLDLPSPPVSSSLFSLLLLLFSVRETKYTKNIMVMMTKKQGKSGRKIKGKEMKTAATYTVSRTALITQKEEGKEKFKKDRKRKKQGWCVRHEEVTQGYLWGRERQVSLSQDLLFFRRCVYICESERK